MIPVGNEDGFEISRDREILLHPEYKGAWTKRAAALEQLRLNQNEIIGRLEKAEEAIRLRPFA